VVLHEDSRAEEEGHRCPATRMQTLKTEDEICVTIDEYRRTTKARQWKLVVAHLSFEQRTMITDNEDSRFFLSMLSR
jgi:hypothetical protein